MSINVKKYTKEQMAKMMEDAQEKTAALEAEIAALKNCIDKKNDLIAEYANLKAEMQRKNVVAEQRANYAESHPWRNLWAWVKRKLSRE